MRHEGQESRAQELHPGEVTKQKQQLERGKQQLEKGDRREIKRGDMFVIQQRNDDGEWVDVSSSPRWEKKPPETKKFEEGGKFVWKQWDYDKNKWVKIPGQKDTPRWQPQAPEIREFKEGDKLVYKRYDQESKRWVAVEGAGEAPRWEDKVGSIKEFKVGDELHTYTWDAEKKKWVPFKVDGVAVVSSRFEGKSPEMSAKHRNWKHWVGLKNKSLVEQGKKPLSTGEMEKSYQEMVLKHQVVESAAEPGEGKALAEKQVAFADSTTLVQRMLRQLEDPKTFIGLGRSVLSGFDAITGQYTMFANSFNEGHLLDEELYDFGAAAKSAALKSNILGMGYALARSQEGKGGRLSESDVRNAIERITGSLQSKATMAASLIEVYNTILRNAKHTYTLARDRGVRGAEADWSEYIKPLNTGEMKSYSRPGFRGIGYKTFVIKNGEKIEMLQTIAEWPVED